MRFLLKLSLMAAMMFVPVSLVLAQEPAQPQTPAPEQVQPADTAVQQDAADAQAAAPAEQPAPSNDPGDIITNYFNAMGDIVAKNMDNPAVLVEAFSTYIKENEKPMRTASKNFEAKIAGMKANEAEEYREKVQRKITPALNKLITLLIDFQNRYPEDAAKLDSLLKVDAKYTYQQ